MAIFDEKIEIRERCKGVHCVDLGESFPTSIYLQKIGVDTAENEPLEIWVKIIQYYSFVSLVASPLARGRRAQPHSSASRGLLVGLARGARGELRVLLVIPQVLQAPLDLSSK